MKVLRVYAYYNGFPALAWVGYEDRFHQCFRKNSKGHYERTTGSGSGWCGPYTILELAS